MKAFKWLSTPEKLIMKACAEFYCLQIAGKKKFVLGVMQHYGPAKNMYHFEMRKRP